MSPIPTVPPEPVGGDTTRTIIMAITAIIALFALGVAIWAATSARRSANNSGISAKTATEALRRMGDKEHDFLGPVSPGVINAVREPGPDGSGGIAYGTLTVPRLYRARATRRLRGGGRVDFAPPSGELWPNTPWKFRIEELAAGTNGLTTEAITFRFWPPDAAQTRGNPWGCPCDAASADQDGTGNGHWSYTVRVGILPEGFEPTAGGRHSAG